MRWRLSRRKLLDRPCCPVPVNDAKAVIQNPKAMPVAEKNHEAATIQKIVKNHNGVAKTEKTKPEAKAERLVGTAGNAIGNEAQAVIAGPVAMPPRDGQQHGRNAVPDVDALSPAVSAVSGQTVETRIVPQSKTDKKTADAEKSNGGNIKTTVSALTDGPVSTRAEVDAAKTASSVPRATDSGGAKTQVLTPAVTAVAMTNAERAVSGDATGGAAGHVTGGAPLMTAASSHASIVQGGSSAIDTAGSVDATHRTLMATPTTLEVGVANGTHGWLRIRAEMTGGGVVNASLSTATSSGQEMLHRELPSLTAYLQSERVAVNSVVVQPAGVAGTDSRDLAGRMNGDGGGQARQSGGQGGENRQNTASVPLDRMEESGLYNGLSGVGGDELSPLAQYANGGSWLSVRA